MKSLIFLILVTSCVHAAPGDVKWSFPALGPIRSSPALGTNGSIIFGSHDGNVYALDPCNGTPKWRTETGSALYSSPCVGEDGKVYIGTGKGVVRLDGVTGAMEWSFDPKVPFSSAVICTPSTTSSGRLYFATQTGFSMAVAQKSGALLWNTNLSQVFGGFGALSTFYGSPSVGTDGTIFFCTTAPFSPLGGFILALDPETGKTLWQVRGDNFFQSSPAIGEDGTIFVSGRDRIVYALDSRTGTNKWSTVLGDGMTSSPVIGLDNTLYVGGDDGRLYALDTVTGKQKWRFLCTDSIHSTPAIAADGTVYFGSYDKSVYALDGGTGLKKWSFQTGDFVLSSPLIGPDGTVYIGSHDGNLYAFEGSAPLADTAWPMFKADPRHTGSAKP